MIKELTLPQSSTSQNGTHSRLIDWEIIHKIPGRLRVRIPQLIWDWEYQNRLQRLLLKTRAITESRVNRGGGFLIVSYPENTVAEWALLDYLKQVINLATQKKDTEVFTLETEKKSSWQSLGLPALAMTVALLGSPLEWPLFFTGGLVLVASIPLWQRFSQGFLDQGQINVDCLDILWLSAQLIGGNHIAGALALNLGVIAENLRRDRLEKLEQELYVLFEQQDEEIHWLSDHQHFAPVRPEDKNHWLSSLEETALIQQVKPIAQGAILPTLLMSGGVGLLTNDLGRASAVLPLDLGVSLRGVTPLAVVSALTVAARAGVYIRNGRILEKLAQVDTLVVSLKNLFPFKVNQPKLDGFIQIIEKLQQQSLSIYLVMDSDEWEGQEWVNSLKRIVNKVYIGLDSQNLEQLIEELHQEGKIIAWIDDTTGDSFTTDQADVTISLAKGGYESQADVILHNQNLESLAYTLNLARHTLATAYESLAIAIIPNLMAVSIGVIFGLNPIIAVMINGGSAILAEFKSLQSGILDK
ncbi:Cation transport ATPase-like protein [Gloeothece citriformis PCC 7424]|uniref:Cation transport ATPase-like protein n=1 Tax=Gloeothece citriformis (strain PCC 7424) TaxID=65393 RepID=B7KAL0_GLOC7|nr:ATPase [Gloeothece citriformis]ACK68682.1 Cation transport ATPase-like protein [Gloeothece citriformis PCC 7424]